MGVCVRVTHLQLEQLVEMVDLGVAARDLLPKGHLAALDDKLGDDLLGQVPTLQLVGRLDDAGAEHERASCDLLDGLRTQLLEAIRLQQRAERGLCLLYTSPSPRDRG